jgi:hypothetical protein
MKDQLELVSDDFGHYFEGDVTEGDGLEPGEGQIIPMLKD